MTPEDVRVGRNIPVQDIELLLRDTEGSTSTLPLKPPAPTGAFYFFNDAQSTKNAIRYLAPSPTSTANLEPLFRSKITQLFPLTAKPDHYILKLYRYKYFPNATTKYFAPYPHYGCHWLA